MGVYKYLKDLWQNGNDHDTWQKRYIEWRRQPVTLRIEYPSRLDRARSLGYRGKAGLFLVRQRVSSGSHTRPDWSGGRHSSNSGIRLNLRKNYKLIAEERAARKFTNCEVLNSYFVGHDAKHYWFEVIMVDRTNPSTLSDHRTSWVANGAQKGRVFRGLTSAGRKVRGLRHKGMGAEKARPSRRSHFRRM